MFNKLMTFVLLWTVLILIPVLIGCSFHYHTYPDGRGAYLTKVHYTYKCLPAK